MLVVSWEGIDTSRSEIEIYNASTLWKEDQCWSSWATHLRSFWFNQRKNKACRRKNTPSGEWLKKLQLLRTTRMRILDNNKIEDDNGFGKLLRVQIHDQDGLGSKECIGFFVLFLFLPCLLGKRSIAEDILCLEAHLSDPHKCIWPWHLSWYSSLPAHPHTRRDRNATSVGNNDTNRKSECRYVLVIKLVNNSYYYFSMTISSTVIIVKYLSFIVAIFVSYLLFSWYQQTSLI